MTNQEKRLFIREVAKELFVDAVKSLKDDINLIALACYNSASKLSDVVETMERKQDEEEETKEPECFGYDLRTSKCFDCTFVGKCQENRGAK